VVVVIGAVVKGGTVVVAFGAVVVVVEGGTVVVAFGAVVVVVELLGACVCSRGSW
jgi:hypothetical protein